MPLDMPPVSALEAQLTAPVRISIGTPYTTGRNASARTTVTKAPRTIAIVSIGLYRRTSGALIGSIIGTTGYTLTRNQHTAHATVTGPACQGIRRGTSTRVWAQVRATLYTTTGRRIGAWQGVGAATTITCR